MTIIKKTYKCDICGKEYPHSLYIRGRIAIDHSEEEDVYNDHDIEYKEVCSECTHKITGFVLSLKLENAPVVKMDELEELDEVLSFD